MKILQIIIILPLLCCLNQIYGADDFVEDCDKFFLVHATRKFPVENQLILGTSINVPGEEKEAISKTYFSAAEAPLSRISVHFTLNCLVSNHEHGVWSDCPYIIFVPFIEAVNQVYGGYAEDLFLVGPYNLPPESIILVPLNEERELLNKAHKFKGKVVSYKPEVNTMVELVNIHLKELGAHPVNIISDDVLEYRGKVIKHSEFLAPLISKLPYFDKGYHSQTHLFTIETALKNISQPLYRIAVGRLNEITPPAINTLICNLSLIQTAFESLIQETAEAPLVQKRIIEWQEEVKPWIQIFEKEIEIRNTHQKSLFSSSELILEVIKRKNEIQSLAGEISAEELSQLPLVKEQIKESNMEYTVSCMIGSYPRLLRSLDDLKKKDSELDPSTYKLHYLLTRLFFFEILSPGLMHELPGDITIYLERDFASIVYQPKLEIISIQALKDIFEENKQSMISEFLKVLNSNKILKDILGKFLQRPLWENKQLTINDIEEVGVKLT